MPIFTKKGKTQNLKKELETLRQRADALEAKRLNADAALTFATEARQRHLVEGDLSDLATANALQSDANVAAAQVVALEDAIAIVQARIVDIERQIAELADRASRIATATAVNALIDRWGTAGAAFQTAVSELAELARESAAMVIDAEPLKIFLAAVRDQTKPEADMIVSVMQGHVKAVLGSVAPASLPVEREIVKPKPVERPVTEHVFAMRSIRWRDAEGVQQCVDQYEFADLTPVAAANGRRTRAVVDPSDPRCSQLRGSHGGRHPNMDRALDLDNEATCALAVVSDPVLAAANIVEFDRGPERKIATAGPRS